VYGTNLALALMVAAMSWVIGWKAYLLLQLTAVMVAGSAGV
jgi:omega-6 fatty acid desaturase (delta-12 desaturase)